MDLMLDFDTAIRTDKAINLKNQMYYITSLFLLQVSVFFCERVVAIYLETDCSLSDASC
jgi:hypothetical protein